MDSGDFAMTGQYFVLFYKLTILAHFLSPTEFGIISVTIISFATLSYFSKVNRSIL